MSLILNLRPKNHKLQLQAKLLRTQIVCQAEMVLQTCVIPEVRLRLGIVPMTDMTLFVLVSIMLGELILGEEEGAAELAGRMGFPMVLAQVGLVVEFVLHSEHLLVCQADITTILIHDWHSFDNTKAAWSGWKRCAASDLPCS